MTDPLDLTEELIVYRIYIDPGWLPVWLFNNGKKLYEVDKGLPEDVYWLRSGWDYDRGCLYMEYSNKNFDGQLIPHFYVVVEVTPVIHDLHHLIER